MIGVIGASGARRVSSNDAGGDAGALGTGTGAGVGAGVTTIGDGLTIGDEGAAGGDEGAAGGDAGAAAGDAGAAAGSDRGAAATGPAGAAITGAGTLTTGPVIGDVRCATDRLDASRGALLRGSDAGAVSELSRTPTATKPIAVIASANAAYDGSRWAGRTIPPTTVRKCPSIDHDPIGSLSMTKPN
jgi:hypothetical protein